MSVDVLIAFAITAGVMCVALMGAVYRARHPAAPSHARAPRRRHWLVPSMLVLGLAILVLCAIAIVFTIS